MKEHKRDILFSILLVIVSGCLFFALGILAATKFDMGENGVSIEYDPNAPIFASTTTTTGAPEKIELNAADVEDLMRIEGIGEKTAQKILDYRDKIGGFLFVEQLLDIDGVGEKKFESWSQYMTVVPVETTTDATTAIGASGDDHHTTTVNNVVSSRSEDHTTQTTASATRKATSLPQNISTSVTKISSPSTSTVGTVSQTDSTNTTTSCVAGSLVVCFDLNTVTVEELMTLDGVGEKTAQKIVAYRDRIGGFTCLEQLMEIDGIGEKRYAQLIPFLKLDALDTTATVATVAPTMTDRFNLNIATLEDLMSIDGIGEVTAQKILSYREQIGAFTDLSQLMDIDGIGEKKYQLLCRYLTLED